MILGHLPVFAQPLTFPALLFCIGFALLAAALPAASDAWRETTSQSGEFRVENRPADGILSLEVRDIKPLPHDSGDYLILAVAPPAADARPRLELTGFTALHEPSREVLVYRQEDESTSEAQKLYRWMKRSIKIQDSGYAGEYFLTSVSWDAKRNSLNYRLIGFEATITTRPHRVPAELGNKPPNESTLRRLGWLVNNPEDLAACRAQSGPSLPLYEQQWQYHADRAAPWVAFDVREEGLAVLRKRDLLEAKVFADASQLPEKLALYRDGKQVPVLKRGGNYYFYALPSEDEFHLPSSYWFRADTQTDGIELPTLDVPPTDRVATPITFSQHTTSIDRDDQFVTKRDRFMTILDHEWAHAQLGENESLTVEFDLPGFLPNRENDTMGIYVYYTGERLNRNLTIYPTLNGTELPHEKIKISTRETITWEIDTNLLKALGNELIIHRTGRAAPGAALWLDKVEITHQRSHYANQLPYEITISAQRNVGNPVARIEGISDLRDDLIVLEITDPEQPSLVALEDAATPEAAAFIDLRLGENTERQLSVASIFDATAYNDFIRPSKSPLTWKSQTEPVELLIVYHSDFEKAAQRLAEFHKQAGRPTQIVDVDSVYSEFNYGQQSPVAIRRFLAHAVTSWQHVPSSVLLIGDCTHDYRDEYKQPVVNYLPSFRVKEGDLRVSPGFPSDQRYACLQGDDLLADIAVGRFSVSTLDDAMAIVDKLIAYDETPTLGPWRTTLGGVADSGEFPLELEELRRHHQPAEKRERLLYLDRLPWINNYLFSKADLERTRSKISPEATTRIRQMFEEGLFYLCYYGHGSPNIWSDERMWFGGGSPNSDNLLLRNFPRLPFVANMTCNTGAIDYPLPPWNLCLTEDLLRQRDGGALGVYAPGGLGTIDAHRRMSIELRRGLFNREITRLGDMTTLAKQRYFLRGFEEKILLMYLYQGDPLAEIQRPSEMLDVSLADGSSYVSPKSSMVDIKLDGWQNFPDAQANATLINPNSDTIWKYEGAFADLLKSSRAFNQFTIALPDKPLKGQYRFSMYVWSGEANRDAEGGCLFRIGSPELLLKDIRFDGNTGLIEQADDGSPLKKKLIIDIVNDGELPVHQHPVFLEEKSVQQSDGSAWQVRQTKLVSLQPNETLRWEAEAEPQFDVSLWRASIGMPGNMPAQQKKLKASSRRHHYTVTARPDAPTGAWFLHDMSSIIDQPGTKNRRIPAEFWVLVNMPHTEDEEDSSERKTPDERDNPFVLEIISEAGTLLHSAKLGEFHRGRAHLVTYNADFRRDPLVKEIPLDEALDGYTLNAKIYHQSPDGTKGDLFDSFSLRWDTESSPDLTITNLNLLTPEPTVGETVFVETDIKNTGNATAYDIRGYLTTLKSRGVNFTWADDQTLLVGGKPVGWTNYGQNLGSEAGHDIMPTQIDMLEPGEEASLLMRWDPFDELSDFTGLMRVTHGAEALEKSLDDNVAPFRVRFRKQFELVFEGRPTLKVEAVDPRQRLVKLSSTVANTGETDVHRVEVKFYASQDDIDNKRDPIYIDLIPVMKAGTKHQSETTYQLNETQTEHGFSPVAQAAVKGSRQRVYSD
jgi:hypothetical protein